MGFGVSGLGFRVWDLEFWLQGLGSKVQDVAFRILCVGCSVTSFLPAYPSITIAKVTPRSYSKYLCPSNNAYINPVSISLSSFFCT